MNNENEGITSYPDKDTDSAPDNSADIITPEDAQPYSQYLPPAGSAGESSRYDAPREAYGYALRNEYGSGYGYPPYRTNSVAQGNSKLKIIIIAISVAVLIMATALIFIRSGLMNAQPVFEFPTFPVIETRSPQVTAPAPAPQLPQDDTPAEGSIPRGAVGTGVVINLASREELDTLPLQEIYKVCSPWVVAIEAAVSQRSYNWGTGIIFTEDGYIVTNSHIIEGTHSVRITLHDDSIYDAVLIGSDSRSDLAVLKIDARELPHAVFGDSSEIEVGEDVLAIGNPLGYEFRSTLTDGIISAIDRSVVMDGYSMTLLQTNAAINEGNSGGPLINLHGQVIGITNMKMISYYQGIEGIGFAIPSRQMKTIVDQLVEKGYAAGPPMLGITGGTLPEDGENEELPPGVYVDSVNKAADVYRKGLRPGDIITAINGEPVASIDDINAAKADCGIGDELTLTVYRNGKVFDIDIVLMDGNELG